MSREALGLGQTDYDSMTPEDKLIVLQGTLNALTASMRLAKAAGNTAALAGLATQLRAVSNMASALRMEANAKGYPSSFLMTLSDFSDTIIGAAKGAGAAIGSTLKLLPVILVALGLGIAFIYKPRRKTT